MNIHDKFMSYVSKEPNGCWLWTGTIMKNGYGRFHYDYESYLAHRYSFFLFIKTPSKLVCHTCDTRHCVNPSHLFEGDYLANNQDRVKKGRSATGSKNGMNTCPDRRPCGEDNGSSKLTLKDVEQIRILIGQKVPDTTIARTYGVHSKSIYNIRNNRTYHAAKLRQRAEDI